MQKVFKRVEYSPEVDALVITLGDNSPRYGESVGDNIIIHFDEKGQPVEIEFLNASDLVLSPVEVITAKARGGAF